MEVPLTTIELKWLKTETKEYYPSQKKYEADVETLLKSHPMCLDTETYCRTTKSSELGVNAGVIWQTKETLLGTMQRPHEDPRVVENWDRRRKIQEALQVMEGLTAGASFGGSTEGLGTGGESIGGRH